MISSITPLTSGMSSMAPITSLFEEGKEQTQSSGIAGGFGSIFQSAIDAVKESDAEKTQMQYLMATGQLDNPVALNMASTKYELSVSLLAQLRNRAVEAYNELMRISL
ncbi:MAG: flagellar hook-basal body complex protein FliE [Acutalibacter sp.]|jgi:flagellar hook-basal body complex protein FliE|nr:flagellar hook-basal body complex protein FliE [Acutalibacter sp.]